MMHFNADLASLQQFFLDILGGKLSDEQEEEKTLG